MTLVVLVPILVLGLLAPPRVAEAQKAGKVYQIGILATIAPLGVQQAGDVFRLGMREKGWIEGQNFLIEYRSAKGKAERLPELADELVRLRVDVIVVWGNQAAAAATRATTRIPIVVIAADPVGSGLVQSLARPGGNVTGLSREASPATFAKNLELLKEVAPRIARVGVLAGAPGSAAYRTASGDAARRLSVTLRRVDVRTPEDLEDAFAALARGGAGGMMASGDPIVLQLRSQIVALAGKHRLPAIYPAREFVDAGGLMSYGVSSTLLAHHAAAYVDKILRGANPADLPVEQPTRFELVVNMRTAKALGLTIPPSLLLRADQVIE
jgi:putative ABC transport system substrate-binding protein